MWRKTKGQLSIAIDLTTYKYFMYNHAGILVNRVDFSKTIEKYGNPVETSPNGLVYILQKPSNPLTIHLFALTYDGFKRVKSINLHNAIWAYLRDLEAATNDPEEIS
jgi:hypothetical protein